jgi:hypothetical protein
MWQPGETLMEEFQRIFVLLEVIHKASICGPDYSWAAQKAKVELDKLKEIEQCPKTPSENTDQTAVMALARRTAASQK